VIEGLGIGKLHDTTGLFFSGLGDKARNPEDPTLRDQEIFKPYFSKTETS
jgi:hypothetical protein